MGMSRHVVIFSANYLPNIGGIERFTEGVARALADIGTHVTIVTNNCFSLPAKESLGEGVEIVRLPCHPLIGGRFPLPKLNGEFNNLMSFLYSTPCDGVLINARFYVHSILGLRFAKHKGLTPIVLDHGSAYLTFGNKALDVFVKAYEHVITSFVKRYKPIFYGVSCKSVEWLRTFDIDAKGVLSNSIDASNYRKQESGRNFRSELGIDEDALLVSFSGRLIPEKGISILIKTMVLLHSAPVHLIVAGDGPMRREVEDAAGGRLHYVGRLSQPDIASLMISSDLFFLPTRSEGFSTSLLEAASCGTPFLSTDVGGARELAPSREYGIVVEGNPGVQAFAEIIRSLVSRRDELALMGGRCRERVEKQYSWNQTAINVLKAMNLE